MGRKTAGMTECCDENTQGRAERLHAAAPSLCRWFAEHARSFPWREKRTPYKVLVSETMLQQTRIEAVLRYYERFMTAFPTLAALAQAPEDLVMKHWEGLGYYSRVRNLKRTAEICAERYRGELPETYEALTKLPGLGSYSAGAVASLCHDKPVPAVDGNVLRVLSRFFGDERDVRLPAVRKEAEQVIRLVLNAGISPSLFNEGLMELGETLCAPKGKPECGLCPFREACRAHGEGREEMLPVRSQGPGRKTEEKIVWVFLYDGRVALEKRQEKGLLHGLYGFPLTEGVSGDSPETPEKTEDEETASALAHLRAGGITPVTLTPLGRARHIFTHREWRMTGYLVETDAPLPAYLYVTPEELEQAYALPSAFRYYRGKALQACQNRLR